MKKLFLFFFAILCWVQASSQEVNLPQYLIYMGDNPFAITPSYVGIGSGLRIRLTGLSQWIGIKDAPQTQTLSLESRIGERFGSGLVIFNDSNGNTSQSGFKVTFASHLTLNEFKQSFLSFGLTYSLITFNINANDFEDLDVGLASNFNLNLSNFDISMLYRLKNYSASINISNLLDKERQLFSDGEPIRLRRYSFYQSYVYSRFNDSFEIEPSLLIEYYEADKRTRTDLNLKFRKRIGDGYIWGGLSYNFLNNRILNPNTLAPLIGIKKGNLYASYGFGINLNSIQNFNAGSHMITLGYDFKKKPSLARCTQKFYMFQ